MSISPSEYNYQEYVYETRDETYFRNAYGMNPFYPTMGQPLVYYTETPQPIGIKHCGRVRQKGSPNCFVKAFRWYTQELVPREVSPIKEKSKPHTAGFAEWLDTKYDEFLKQNQNLSQVSLRVDLKMKPSSEAIARDRIPEKCTCDSFTVRRPRGKSPFKKRRRTKSNESGDARMESNESLRYLMQPKNLSRATSDCCLSPYGGSESNKKLCKSQSFSNFTIVIKSKEQADVMPVPPNSKNFMPCTCKPLDEKKSVEKVERPIDRPMVTKQSFGCQNFEEKPLKVDVGSQYDVSVTANSCELAPSKKIESVDKCACPSHDTMAEKPNPRVSVCTPRQPQENIGSISHKNVECQFPEEKVKFVDAQSQHEEAGPKLSSYNIVCECNKGSHQRVYTPPKQSTAKISNVCPCETKIIEKLPTERQTHVTFSQNTTQTSNHSIFVANGTVHKYPLFMKIVCADKL